MLLDSYIPNFGSCTAPAKKISQQPKMILLTILDWTYKTFGGGQLIHYNKINEAFFYGKCQQDYVLIYYHLEQKMKSEINPQT